MIVKNEEETIARCLDSVKDAVDEIVVVDTGSTDRTKEIASGYTSSVYDFEWIHDFSAARNFSFSKATKDYILWLDADDVVLDEDLQKLKALKIKLDPTVDIVMMKYNLGTDKSGQPSTTYYRERLIKRANNYKWQNPVHEYINLTGKILRVDIAITHKKTKQRTSRNLEIFEHMVQAGKELSHRNCFYYARELNVNGKYDEAAMYFEKFLDQEGGLISNYIDACIDLSNIYTRKGDRRKAIRTLLRCFEHGVPRAEICCQIGSQYKELGKYEIAIAWYQISANLKKPEDTLGSVVHDTYDYIPYAEISVCYFKLGQIQEAIQYNELAAKVKPNSLIVNQNRKYYLTIVENVKKMV